MKNNFPRDTSNYIYLIGSNVHDDAEAKEQRNVSLFLDDGTKSFRFFTFSAVAKSVVIAEIGAGSEQGSCPDWATEVGNVAIEVLREGADRAAF